jgi:hypothetical protein
MIVVKNVMGYEGLYLIDNTGNVISMPKQQGSRFVNQYSILKPKVNKFGYQEVALSKEGKTTTFLLHRLIGLHFVDNPNGYSCINHKNGIKTDNRIDNLEWCTHSQNTKHAYENDLSGFRNSVDKGIEKMNRDKQYTSIVLISPEGEEERFTCSSDAARFLNTHRDEITRAIRKNQRVKGYYAYGEKSCANGET